MQDLQMGKERSRVFWVAHSQRDLGTLTTCEISVLAPAAAVNVCMALGMVAPLPPGGNGIPKVGTQEEDNLEEEEDKENKEQDKENKDVKEEDKDKEEGNKNESNKDKKEDNEKTNPETRIRRRTMTTLPGQKAPNKKKEKSKSGFIRSSNRESGEKPGEARSVKTTHSGKPNDPACSLG